MALATKYSEIQAGRSMRSRTRHLVLDALSLTNFTKANRARTPRVQFVYIHHVFDDEVEEVRKLEESEQLRSDFINQEKLLLGAEDWMNETCARLLKHLQH